jgi:hypothetical protein
LLNGETRLVAFENITSYELKQLIIMKYKLDVDVDNMILAWKNEELNHRFTTLKEYGIKNNDVVEVKEEL